MAKTDKTAKKLLSKLLPAPLSLGVEVSEYSIKLVLVKQESPESASLLDYTIIPLVARVVRSKLNPLSVIQNILKEKKLFTAREAKLVVSGADLDCKRIALPFMPKKEIAQALSLEAKDQFLFGVEESVLDYEIIGEASAADGTRSIEVMASLVKNSLVDEKLSFFEGTRVSPSAIIPAAYGLYNLYRLGREEESDVPVALLDIGGSTSTVVIIKNDRIRFIRQFGCGGNNFTKAITGAFVSDKGKIELSPGEAEELKIQMGIPDESTPEVKEGVPTQQVNSMLRPVLEKLSNEIRRSFEYYTSKFNEGMVRKVIISGGTSKLKNMHTQLSHRLKNIYPQISQSLSIPVEFLKVPEGLKVDLTDERANSFKEDFPVLAAAIGAALSSDHAINLMPATYNIEKIKTIRKVSIRFIFIIISLVLLTVYLFNSAQKKLLANILLTKQPQWQKLQEIQSLHSAIAQKNAIIERTLKNQVPLYYVFKALSSFIPRAVYLENLVIKDKASNLRMGGIILETSESSEVTLANFIKALEDSPFFNNVYLVSSQDTDVSGKQALEFEISCKL